MLKRLIILCILVVVGFSLFAQQGKYERKSVSSVESVWLSSNANAAGDFNVDFFNRMIDLYIKVPRFDYNQLPESVISEFRNQANSLGDINEGNIAGVMQSTIIPAIKQILEDPAVQQARKGNFADESEQVSFAATKAKDFGMTEEQLRALMNSAYIYLPYISKITKEVDDKTSTFSYRIDGGILWYRVKINGDGSVTLVKKPSSIAWGIGTSNPKKPLAYASYFLGAEVFHTTPEEHAQFSACQAWVKNLGVRMKEMPEFALSAQIMEKLPGNKLSAQIGHKEGIFLDDGFFITEVYEDAKGELQKRRLGYTRNIKTADNITKGNENEKSLFQVYYADRVSEGSVLMENPRLGIDLTVAIGARTGMNIPKESTDNMITEDITSQTELNLAFSYNLAPIVGVSQLFYDLELGYGMMSPSYIEESSGVYYSELTASTISLYTGLYKKRWWGKSALSFGAKVGLDVLSISGKYNDVYYTDVDESVSTSAWGVKLGADYQYMLNPNLLLNIGLDYKLGTAPGTMNHEWNGSALDDDDVLKPEDVNLGGIMFRVGVNYALGQLPINLFGWLDPFKKF